MLMKISFFLERILLFSILQIGLYYDDSGASGVEAVRVGVQLLPEDDAAARSQFHTGLRCGTHRTRGRQAAQRRLLQDQTEEHHRRGIRGYLLVS